MTNCNHECNKCDVTLTPNVNWAPSRVKSGTYICKTCNNKISTKYHKDNHEHHLKWCREHHYKNGVKPMSENKECASYLGCHIAEQVLSKVFKDVKIMPNNNPGFDFICNHGKTIDVKSSCICKYGGWKFNITKNTIADYFLCIAFNDRTDLNPMYIWLLPGNLVNHLTGTSISKSTIYKWNEYKLDITKTIACCDNMRSGSNGN